MLTDEEMTVLQQKIKLGEFLAYGSSEGILEFLHSLPVEDRITLYAAKGTFGTVLHDIVFQSRRDHLKIPSDKLLDAVFDGFSPEQQNQCLALKNYSNYGCSVLSFMVDKHNPDMLATAIAPLSKEQRIERLLDKNDKGETVMDEISEYDSRDIYSSKISRLIQIVTEGLDQEEIAKVYGGMKKTPSGSYLKLQKSQDGGHIATLVEADGTQTNRISTRAGGRVRRHTIEPDGYINKKSWTKTLTKGSEEVVMQPDYDTGRPYR